MTPNASSAPLLRDPVNRVSRRAILYWTLRALVTVVIVVAVEVVIFFVGGATLPGARWYILGVTLAIGIAYLVVMPRWRYAVHKWETTATATYTQTGWFNVERRIAPISRVQTVDSHRGPIEQLLKLANVTITTASAAGPLKIHGLDHSTAESLVEELTRRAEAETGDAT